MGRQPDRLSRRDGDQADRREAGDFGVVFATARTQVDKVARTVVFENLNITKSDFPTLPDHGAAYAAELQTQLRAATCSTISLDRLEASLAAAGIKPPSLHVNNAPPQVIVSYSPAILVPIDGAPVMKPIAESLALPTRHQHARADHSGRSRRQLLHPRLRRLAHGRARSPGPWSSAVHGALRAQRARHDCASNSHKRRPSISSTAGRRQSQAVARQRRADDLHGARCPPSSSCSTASPTSCPSSARSCCGRRTRRTTC